MSLSDSNEKTYTESELNAAIAAAYGVAAQNATSWGDQCAGGSGGEIIPSGPSKGQRYGEGYYNLAKSILVLTPASVRQWQEEHDAATYALAVMKVDEKWQKRLKHDPSVSCARCQHLTICVRVETGFAGEVEYLCGRCTSIERAKSEEHDRAVTMREHANHVEFASRMYAIMIDPLSDGNIREAELFDALQRAALEQRQQIHDFPDKLQAVASAAREECALQMDALVEAWIELADKTDSRIGSVSRDLRGCAEELTDLAVVIRSVPKGGQ